MLSLVVSQPSTIDSFIGAALNGGATALRRAKKGFWGYGGVVQAPDGAIWKVATSAKEDIGPATRRIDDIVLLLGVADVKASQQFYVGRGLAVAKSFGSKYVEFATAESSVKLALYGRRAAAKDAGISPDGTGSHRNVIGSDAGPFTDPGGFPWAPENRGDRGDRSGRRSGGATTGRRGTARRHRAVEPHRAVRPPRGAAFRPGRGVNSCSARTPTATPSGCSVPTASRTPSCAPACSPSSSSA